MRSVAAVVYRKTSVPARFKVTSTFVTSRTLIICDYFVFVVVVLVVVPFRFFFFDFHKVTLLIFFNKNAQKYWVCFSGFSIRN